MTPLLRHIDDHGHVQAPFVDVPLASGEGAPVIPVIEDDGIVHEAIRLQLGDKLAHFPVHLHVQVAVQRVGVAEQGRIRMYREYGYTLRVRHGRILLHLRAAEMQPALVGGSKILDMKERLPLLPVTV